PLITDYEPITQHPPLRGVEQRVGHSRIVEVEQSDDAQRWMLRDGFVVRNQGLGVGSWGLGLRSRNSPVRRWSVVSGRWSVVGRLDQRVDRAEVTMREISFSAGEELAHLVDRLN